jgi:hypothetical protein
MAGSSGRSHKYVAALIWALWQRQKSRWVGGMLLCLQCSQHSLPSGWVELKFELVVSMMLSKAALCCHHSKHSCWHTHFRCASVVKQRVHHQGVQWCCRLAHCVAVGEVGCLEAPAAWSAFAFPRVVG